VPKLLFCKGGLMITEPDVLIRQIHELKEWQRAAWQRVADPMLTAFERREIRNHIRESEGDLRQHLASMSERLAFRPRPVEDIRDDVAQPKFRLLA
jgi:hypothetical protein